MSSTVAFLTFLLVGTATLGAAQNTTADGESPAQIAALTAFRDNNPGALAAASNSATDGELVTPLIFVIAQGGGETAVQTIKNALSSLSDASAETPKLLVDWGTALAVAIRDAPSDTGVAAVGSAVNGGLQAGGSLSLATLGGLEAAKDIAGCDRVRTAIAEGNVAAAVQSVNGEKGDAPKVFCEAIKSIGGLEACAPQYFPSNSAYVADLCG